MEKVVGVMAKLLSARSAMRSFHGDKYAENIAEYQGYIRKRMAMLGEDDLKATMNLVGLLQKNVYGSEMQQALLLAAYVEMVEPSAPTPEGMGLPPRRAAAR